MTRSLLYSAVLVPLCLQTACTTAPSEGTASMGTVRCFYGNSISFSSYRTALNGQVFATVYEDGDNAFCKVVLWHQSRFYKTVMVKEGERLREGIEFSGAIDIEDKTVPLRFQLKKGRVFGQVGETGDVDKGVVALDDFDCR